MRSRLDTAMPESVILEIRDHSLPNQEVPAGLDWDMWCGPAPYRPYNSAIQPKKWRQFLDYANGQIGDWVHWTD